MNPGLLAAPPASPPPLLSSSEREQFARDGFLICRGVASAETVAAMRAVTEEGLAGGVGPVEYESELHYPGAPDSLEAEGGRTIRRLKQAQSRHPAFTEFVGGRAVAGRLQGLLRPPVVMPLAHHNCIMTKQPRFSSDTLWHQDVRYWNYRRPELVSAWLALGPERPANGCLWVIPGSHRESYRRDQFDEALFFRTDLAENQAVIGRKVPVELDAGDLLLFHCRTFHAASKNHTGEAKFSVVFTFRPWDNPPVPGSRSAALPELLLPDG